MRGILGKLLVGISLVALVALGIIVGTMVTMVIRGESPRQLAESNKSPGQAANADDTEPKADTQQNQTQDLKEPVQSNSETEPRTDCDFRNTKWGDSVDDVTKYEKKNVEFYGSEEDGILPASTTLNGYNTYVFYYFDNGKLYQGAYVLNPGYRDAGQYIDVYNVLKNSLEDKYGTPSASGIASHHQERLIEIAGEAGALQFGYVTYYVEWNTSTTEIGMVMESVNNAIQLRIYYKDLQHIDVIDPGL